VSKTWPERVRELPWSRLLEELEQEGAAIVPGLLTADECEKIVSLYGQPGLFRSKVLMARHGYGRGEYQYFDYPLPEPIAELRSALYAELAPVANRWHEALGFEARFPSQHAEFIARCQAAGQTRPTPLILRYGVGDYNRLHQDLYGEQVFPLQVAALLSEPGRDFEGGHFVLTEQRARQQSRPVVLAPRRGDAIVFAVRHRPVPSKRGSARVQMRHGVSRLLRGQRHMLGIIFHDAV